MAKRVFVIMLAVALVAGLPALAGEKHGCKSGTQDCLNKMAAKFKDRGWVGVELDHNENGSMTVLEVIDGSPAQAAGLKSGDVLLAFNGVEFGDDNSKKLKQAQVEMKVGNTIEYTVKRNGKTKDVAIKLAPIPEEVVYAWVGQHMMQGHSTIEIASN